jgi:hypothetical protein
MHTYLIDDIFIALTQAHDLSSIDLHDINQQIATEQQPMSTRRQAWKPGLPSAINEQDSSIVNTGPISVDVRRMTHMTACDVVNDDTHDLVIKEVVANSSPRLPVRTTNHKSSTDEINSSNERKLKSK